MYKKFEVIFQLHSSYKKPKNKRIRNRFFELPFGKPNTKNEIQEQLR